MNTQHSLSILIPCFNNYCDKQVKELKQLADGCGGLTYEIIVADDGSTEEDVVSNNMIINQWEHCQYILRGVNAGRAAIRNFLISEAQYDWVLFLDCDVMFPDLTFIDRYVSMQGVAEVICGGVGIYSADAENSGNLRYLYEKQEEHNHTAILRSRSPYKSFRTTNFMAKKTIMEEIVFDEDIRSYGYEDVMFGKALEDNNINLIHFDNPVLMYTYEDNDTYLCKIEEAMHTLHSLSEELAGYSPLLKYRNIVISTGMRPLARAFYRWQGARIRSMLCKQPPKVGLFSLYKLIYLISI